MLQQRPAFSGFSVNDIDAARTFYGDILGLTVREDSGMLTLELAGGQRVLIYPKDDHRAATFTVLNFEVPDIDAAVDELSGRGVTFERYDGMPQDERGVMREYGPPIAWFTDPGGNVLALIQTTEQERASP